MTEHRGSTQTAGCPGKSPRATQRRVPILATNPPINPDLELDRTQAAARIMHKA